jgi:propanol-preferring alcohol dehydrogenase
MRAWILEEQARIEERPLKLVEVPTPRPQEGEIRVKVLACGVCRTDIHIAEGDLPLSFPLPATWSNLFSLNWKRVGSW